MAAAAEEVSQLLGQLSLDHQQQPDGGWRPNVPTLETPRDEVLVAVEPGSAASATTDQQTQVIYKKFGMFKCPKCAHKWTSVHAWRKKGQLCLNCSDDTREVYVLPHQVMQRQQVSGGRHVGQMKHQRELCQMCQQLKRNCATVNAVKKVKKNKKKNKKQTNSS